MMVVAELRPILKIYNTDIIDYALQAYKMYTEDKMAHSFYDYAKTTLTNALGISVLCSVSDEEIDNLISLMAEEIIKKLTKDRMEEK